MKIKSQTRTEQILTVMHILAWIAFVGYLIESGAILLSFGVSTVNPEASKNLYKGLDLYSLREFNFWHYTLTISFMVAISLMKSYVCYLVITTLSKMSVTNPFKMEVARTLEKISHVLFGTWLVGMLSSGHSAWLMKLTGELYGSWVSAEFIFMAGLVFIISQVFKRGVEIQSENELTV
jgi:hypothetical protein